SRPLFSSVRCRFIRHRARDFVYALLRQPASGQSPDDFQARISVCARTARYWNSQGSPTASFCARLLCRRESCILEVVVFFKPYRPRIARSLGSDSVCDVGFAGGHGMNRCLRSLSCFFTVAGIALFATDATARPSHKPQTQKAREAAKKPHAVKEARSHRGAKPGKNQHAKQASAQRKAKPSKPAPAPKEASPPLTGDLALVKEAIDLARKAKTEEATDIRNRIADPAAQKLVEW